MNNESYDLADGCDDIAGQKLQSEKCNRKKRTHHEKRMQELQNLHLHDAVMAFYTQCMGELGDGLSLLDLGAGSGLVSKTLDANPFVDSIVAYDKDLSFMRELEEGQKILKCADGSTTNLPFENELFDVVICRYAFHHFEQKLESLNEISRVLKSTGIFLYSDPVLPDHSKNVLNPLYVIREDNFYKYLGYFDTINLLCDAGFTPVLMRPYKYRYPNFHKYLEGVDDGCTYPPDGIESFLPTLKTKIRRAWLHLDEKTREEMKIIQQEESISFRYNFMDIACMKTFE